MKLFTCLIETKFCKMIILLFMQLLIPGYSFPRRFPSYLPSNLGSKAVVPMSLQYNSFPFLWDFRSPTFSHTDHSGVPKSAFTFLQSFTASPKADFPPAQPTTLPAKEVSRCWTDVYYAVSMQTPLCLPVHIHSHKWLQTYEKERMRGEQSRKGR